MWIAFPIDWITESRLHIHRLTFQRHSSKTLRLQTGRCPLLPFSLLLLLLLLVLFNQTAATTRGMRAKKRPAAQQEPSPSPELALTSCYETALSSTSNGTIPLFGGRFSEQAFPFCKVLTPGRAVLYWRWSNASHAEDGDGVGVGARDSSSTTTGRSRETPRSPSDAAGVNITMGVLLRRNLSTTTTAASCAALGLSEESGGMPGMDVAMLRGPNEVKLIA